MSCHILFCRILSRPVPYLPCPALPCPVLPCSALHCPACLALTFLPSAPTHTIRPRLAPCPAALTIHPLPPFAEPSDLPSLISSATPFPCPAVITATPIVFCCLPLYLLLCLLCPPPCPWHDPTLIFICAILVLPWTQFWPCSCYHSCPMSCALPPHMPPAHHMPYSSLPS